ncbi:MAG: methylated-DNA--[protein]-cysteine S-methyltransferase [Chlorobi bacterium]|nr:methylated-DNA--[protein]-cysteine S-methyltransferase [Chlorobiota bacterium]MCI0716232.1 methylated-DNA--[protein]-cysteine S-methyltransferase [Chlorobiota bacterium]
MNTTLSTLPPQSEMKRALYARDKSYDGIFFAAIKSTGIFCRPGCSSRKPKEENIVFYPSARDAMFAGFRACKKCRPLELSGSHPEWVKKLMEQVDKSEIKRIKDSQLRKMGIEPARARRYFLKNYGITFHAYQRSRRLSEALTQIRNGSDLDDVIFSNGYESHSGFRDAFGKVFGKSPGKSRSSEAVVTSLLESELGPIILGATSKGLCLAEFTERRMLEFQLKTLRKRFDSAIVPGNNEHIEQAKAELKEYFAGNLKNFKVPLVYPGTEFQVKVWNELRKIPYGKTISYIELAERAGYKGASRAVGTANGMNRIAIIIPCHRVVNKNGKLGGYGGGVWRKQWLLDLERGVLKL